MNNINLIGNVAGNPENRISKKDENKEFTTLTVCVNNQYHGSDTDFFNCVAFGKIAELISNYVTKGDKIGVNGRINFTTFKDKNGITRINHTVIINDITFCSSKKDKDKNEGFEVVGGFDDDGLPF